MIMNTKSPKTPTELFDQWQREDEQLEAYIHDLRGWMNEVNQLGIPHFGEAGVRLTAFRKRMVKHFESEDEIIAQLAENFSGADASVVKLRSQSRRKHEKILTHVDGLMNRLDQLEPPFESWVAMMQEVESFIDGLS